MAPKPLDFRVFVALILSFISCVSFRKRKSDEVDGIDRVPKKKSKKEKDKDSKLEKALKVSSELCVSCYSVSVLFRHSGQKGQEGVHVPLTKTFRNSQIDSCC